MPADTLAELPTDDLSYTAQHPSSCQPERAAVCRDIRLSVTDSGCRDGPIAPVRCYVLYAPMW